MTHEEILTLLYEETLVGNAPAVKDGVNQGLELGMDPGVVRTVMWMRASTSSVSSTSNSAADPLNASSRIHWNLRRSSVV